MNLKIRSTTNQIFFWAGTQFFFLIYLMKPSFFSGCQPEKLGMNSTLFFSGWQKCLIFFRVATSWCRLNMWLAINSAALEFCQMELETMLVFEEEVLGLRFTYNDMKTILSNGHRVYMNSQVSEVYCM